MSDDDLKLIFVLKIGYDSKGNGLYEFIFSEDETNIDVEGWMWDIEPACDNAEVPPEDYVSKIVGLKTKSFDLFCLHEAVDRPYIHGYHTIHALAYEVDFEGDENAFDDYEDMFNGEDDDKPLLVFHYGITLGTVKEMFYERKIVLKDDSFIESSAYKI